MTRHEDPARTTSAPRRALLVLLALIGGVLGGGVTHAAAQAPAGESSEPAPERSEAPSEEAAPFDSPRDALGHFLSHMRAYEFELEPGADEEATRALMAGDGAQGLERARQLYGILNRVGTIDVEALPGPDSAALQGRARWVGPPRSVPGAPGLTVVLAFRRDAEWGWRVDEETLSRVPALWKRVAELPVAAGFRANLGPLEGLRYDVREALPEAFARRTFLVENWQWLGLALLLFAAVVLDRVVRFVLRRVVGRVLRRLRTLLSGDALADFERPVGILAAALFFGALLPVLGIDPVFANPLDLATSFVAAIAGIWAAYRLVDVFSEALTERASRTQSRFDDVLVPLVRRTLKILLTVVALFFVASRWTEDLWGIVAGLSIGSLAIGFAARDSIENLFGTFTVLLDKPFELGDWITVGEIDGTVEAVGFRSTRVRTFKDSVVTAPNRLFISAHVENWGKRRYRRIHATLALTYDTPPALVEAFCEGVRELIRSHPYTRKDSFHVYLNQLGASSLDVLLYCFVRTPDWATELRERHRLLADVLALAHRLDVSFAFPTQSLHVVKPEDLEHPGAPAGDDEARERGRAAARELASALGDEVPPPVSF